ncbi:MAG: diguanylate cyclase [Rheinheimera sp.]|uniref:sensor domain-containing diguanylate cyclase n=1 Tax=Arsukibacterium sp. UBA3155 TaxID=1946058 RepID=UPI000C97318D|nr:sensor domain-containing diguanylate cyclase [Arsukibacterium sp. UBA3155]MAD77038.1 diguanylate cyclase [Rheinheimera sp.]|tara:strand:- start:16832 stop:18253 length:1422 start_codon:yes stop_codon:yes gene_type:complete
MQLANKIGTLLPWRNALLLFLWLAVWALGLLVEYAPHASVWFPVAGLTCAAMLVVGIRAVPAILIAAVIITFWTALHYDIDMSNRQLIEAGLLFGIAHIFPYYLGAVTLRKLSAVSKYNLPLFVVSFLVLAVGCSLLATAAVLSSLVFTGLMPAADVASTWLPFWIGDMAGVVVIAPMFASILLYVFPERKFNIHLVIGIHSKLASHHFKYKLSLTIVMLLVAMLIARYSGSSESAFAIFFLVIPHMWIACTETPFITVVSLALTSFLIALLVNLFGLMDNVMVYQFAINVIAANALFGLAVPALVASNNQLRLVASTDTLTRVASRSYLQQRADLEITRSLQQSEPLCLMVFDIDHFKQINDHYGHSIGDEVLRLACQHAQHLLRPADIIGRYGGDEFVVVLPNTAKEAVVAIGNRIIERLLQIELAEQLKVSASFGVAALQQGDNFRSLFERADAALYRAKQQGRSQVAWH